MNCCSLLWAGCGGGGEVFIYALTLSQDLILLEDSGKDIALPVKTNGSGPNFSEFTALQ